MNHTGNSSNRRLLASLGKSTSDILNFQDFQGMADNISIDGKLNDGGLETLHQVGRLRQPIRRRHSIDRSIDHQGRRKQPLSPHKEHRKEPISPHKKKDSPLIHNEFEQRPREIQLPPLDRGISRNFSSDATISSDVTFESEISLPVHRGASSSATTTSDHTWSSDNAVIPSKRSIQTYHHQQQPKPQSTEAKETWSRPLVEVVPGFALPFHGSKETIHAYHNDNVIHTNCSSCATFLYCIDSASMVLCPSCRSISPVEVRHTEEETLGIGLTVEHVLEEHLNFGSG